MCGISGVIHWGQINEKQVRQIEQINQAMLHRGPDSQATWSDENAVLGHLRLSIIDLSEKANQPMVDKEDELAIVFNGEIYNHASIRSELEEKGVVFNTSHSDTEVILKAYRYWGIDCLKKFSGMFAMVLYDYRDKKVFLVRDRFGKKPLHYVQHKNGLYFASEAHSFFEADILPKKINSTAIYHYLTCYTSVETETFFDGVNKVPLGHYVEFSEEGISRKKYWDIAEALNESETPSFEEAKAETERLLEESMKLRNVSDVPICVALSGGLDSSLNLYYSKKVLKNDVDTLTISYEKTSEYDESVIAKRLSKDFGVKNHYDVRVSDQDYQDWIKEYSKKSKDMPAGDINTFLMYGMSKIVREKGYKVLLVGEGGDELGGYPMYKTLIKIEKLSRYIPAFMKWLYNKIPLSLFFFLGKLGAGDLMRKNFPKGGRFLMGITEKEKQSFWLKEKPQDTYTSFKKITDQISDDLPDIFLRKVQNMEYKIRLSEMLLPRIDYPTMASSIEARSPFMYHKLIAYTMKLPWKFKMDDKPKKIIRAIAEDKLPEYITKAPKVGFGNLLRPFLTTTLQDWFYKEIILDKNAPVREYVSEKYLNKIYGFKTWFNNEVHQEKKGFRLWTIYSLNLWLKTNAK